MSSLHIDLTEHHRRLRGRTMPAALDYAAAQWPDQTAIKVIEGEQGAYTWSQFRHAVDCLRTGLEGAGLRVGEKVGIMLRNGMAFPLTWIAVIEAGAIAVPLNPKYTVREVDFVLTDAGATWLVTTEADWQRLVRDGEVGRVPRARTVISDEAALAGSSPVSGTTAGLGGQGGQGGSGGPDGVGAAGRPGQLPAAGHLEQLLATAPQPRRHQPHPRDIVNIQFTSGTTGLPKGCELTHEYWVEFGVFSSGLFDQPQRLLADHPFYYMQNQAYFWIALAGGGAIYVTQGLSRRKFMGWLVDHQIDFAWIDEGLLDEPARETDGQLALKKAPIAGISGDVHRQLESRFNLQARDWYASTEAGNGTFVPWERDDLVGVATIGLAWPTRESKLIDDLGNEVAAGESGELCLRGPGMMLGYHNRPEVNEELMLAGGWYRTGDLVRKEADGLHYFQGRLKDMVKRSGENISCAEVELHIAQLPEVAEVGVIPVPDDDRGEEVKAIIVLRETEQLPVDRLLDWCREGLAAFKIPRYLEFRDALPHTPSGKVAKAVLRAQPNGDTVIDVRELTTAWPGR